MTEQEFYATQFDCDGEYIGSKYSGFIYLEGQTIMHAMCKRGDVEDEYPCTTYGPWLPNYLWE